MDFVGEKIRNQIKELGKIWRESEHNPKASSIIVDSWDNLVSEWIQDKSLPLIIRRSKELRGHVYHHCSGREIVISDNTVAIWVSYHVINRKTISLSEIRKLLENKELPITLSFDGKKKEKDGATYTKVLGNYNLKGWRVCHIEPVGLNSRKAIEEIDISILEEHFWRYLSPKNMFLIPKNIAGLGEIQEFIDEQR